MRLKRILSFCLIIIGIILLVGSIGALYFNQAFANPGEEPLSKQMAGLTLSAAIKGQEAIQDFTSLHGKQFPISSGAMGLYGSNNQVVLWVAGTPLPPLAAQMVVDMQRKIDEGRSPFKPEGQHLEGGRVVYWLTGMGQQHFYFQAGARVIWLAANPEFAEAALKQALDFYR
jgi:hypothetical protein